MTTSSLSELWSRLTAELLPILAAYRAQLVDLDVTVKADDTLLSAADLAVQERIVALVSEHEPDVRVIAEGAAFDSTRDPRHPDGLGDRSDRRDSGVRATGCP